MAEAVVTFALEQIRDLLLQGQLLTGVGNEVRALEMHLKEMKYLVEDADRRRHESKTVFNWITEIRDLAYRAEAAIEVYAASKGRGGMKKALRRYACVLKEYHSLHRLNSEISHIKSDLERVTKNLQKYGIRRIIDGGESSAASHEQNRRRETFPDFEIEQFRGDGG